MIYQKAVPKEVFDLIMKLITRDAAVHGAGGASGSQEDVDDRVPTEASKEVKDQPEEPKEKEEPEEPKEKEEPKEPKDDLKEVKEELKEESKKQEEPLA